MKGSAAASALEKAGRYLPTGALLAKAGRFLTKISARYTLPALEAFCVFRLFPVTDIYKAVFQCRHEPEQ
ncbi:MAG: hypothetical protein DU429_03390 [Candidatus Tokpelaia sp.]|nr:MAG: hypothetical protein DU430_01255 [Candidatus Tokpelaia sp.]KAA6207157.1 MAG: hypothetical protein DU429_03390 [Candidatus Tokpelaia sp.]